MQMTFPLAPRVRRAAGQTIAIAWIVLLLCDGSGCGRREGKVELDLSTPRSAATVFTRAVETGDADTAKSAAFAGGIEVEWVEAMTSAMRGMKTLLSATEKKFGAESNLLVAQRGMLTFSQSLRDAEVQMNGDRATITSGPSKTTLFLKNIDGKWKIDVGALTRGQDISGLVKHLRALGQVAPQVSADVEAGKFRTVKEIEREMQGRMLQTAYGIEVTPPSTAPAPLPGVQGDL